MPDCFTPRTRGTFFARAGPPGRVVGVTYPTCTVTSKPTLHIGRGSDRPFCYLQVSQYAVRNQSGSKSRPAPYRPIYTSSQRAQTETRLPDLPEDMLSRMHSMLECKDVASYCTTHRQACVNLMSRSAQDNYKFSEHVPFLPFCNNWYIDDDGPPACTDAEFEAWAEDFVVSH